MSSHNQVDCDMENDSPAEKPRNYTNSLLQFDPKYEHLTVVGTLAGERTDSHDSGIGSFRSVDSAPSCYYSSDSSSERVGSIGTCSQYTNLSRQLDSIHISAVAERQPTSESQSGNDNPFAKKLLEEEDEACVECFNSTTSCIVDEIPRQSDTSSGYLTDDAFEQDQEGDTPLHLAIIHKKSNIALTFIYYAENAALYDIKNLLGQTPLHLAVLTQQPKICRVLLLAGAQVDCIDRNGDTPLHIACKMKDDCCMVELTNRISPDEVRTPVTQHEEKTLCELPQNLELRNFEGFTCTHIATFHHNLVQLEHLIVQLGANINMPDGKSGRTALHYAVEMGDFELTHCLVNILKANINALTYDMCTPLHLAAGRGLKTIVMLLMINGADSNIRNNEGEKPADLSQDSQLKMYIQSGKDHDDVTFADITIQGH